MTAKLRPERLPGAVQAPFPGRIQPQTPKLTPDVPTGGWLYEIKFDGYRIIADQRGELHLQTKNWHDWTERYPGIAEALADLPECVIDGELVYLDASGVSNFELLQKAQLQKSQRSLYYYAFDLLYLDGWDLRATPLRVRKVLLAQLISQLHSPRVRYSEHLEGAGEAFYAEACAKGLEGIVCKRADAPYREGAGDCWRKVKCTKRDLFIILGYRGRRGIRSLLLGEYRDGQLVYVGQVAGLAERDGRELLQAMRPTTASRPLPELPAGSQSVAPELLAEVQYLARTGGGRLRHAVFKGWRRAVAEGLELPYPITSPEKILFPDAGISKQQLAYYLLAFGPQLLLELHNRPLALLRCPDGAGAHCFYQKHCPQGEKLLRRAYPGRGGGNRSLIAVADAAGLAALVQMDALELHSWGCRLDRLDRPDRLVLDLDPGEGVAFASVITAAQQLRQEFLRLGLQSFVRTTGSAGLHLVVPLERVHSWDLVRAFAAALASRLAGADPGRFVTRRGRKNRVGKIYIDYLRNSRGATCIANYSPRARPEAPIAAPVSWAELDSLAASDQFHLPDMPARAELDSWRGYADVRQRIRVQALRALGIRSPTE